MAKFVILRKTNKMWECISHILLDQFLRFFAKSPLPLEAQRGDLSLRNNEDLYSSLKISPL